ncbi:unnamed protein product [Candidula unifasciata]|uniref:Uncharacterized protein n=1 Tax=Candidula unifasciata TaxID=100452 RepID=A0A8S3ZXK2_9EUPU|nr:unnamed protein product [Candidula unifasciata]
MHKIQMSILLAFLCFLLVTLSQSAAVSEASRISRHKRQSADVRLAEYLAWIALNGRRPNDCQEVACGVVDVAASGKKKRDFQPVNVSDEERYTLLRYLIQKAAQENNSL